MHIALQGCLRASNIEYGITADTGGHIKYVLELVQAAERAGAKRQQIITRRFKDNTLGPDYRRRFETISAGASIVRIDGASDGYISKEALADEHQALRQSLFRHIETLDQRPDILHAHYADAGWLAAEVKAHFGIPYIFTGHSLGRVKAETLTRQDEIDGLCQRIEIEEYAITHADRIVTSSSDEAELQYAQYRAARPERIRINPPGCDLERLAPDRADITCPKLVGGINRFLQNPEKPAILALARPVRKKNLAGLVKAYGESKGLQARANLVIFAGSRGDLRDEEDEARQELAELLFLVDRYDLWGRVAMPKSHRPDDVPGIYRYAAATGGVFVNIALNEPFGLTFLEAAASGLPVVGTRSGGPNDIIARLRNGELVDAAAPHQTADAIIGLLDDAHRWGACQANGLEEVKFYSWQRHAERYLEDIECLVTPALPRIAVLPPRRQLLMIDIDNTLTGDPLSLRKFAKWQAEDTAFHYVIATGRSLHSALDIIAHWNVPAPEILVTSVGSEIYFAHDLRLDRLSVDVEWKTALEDRWDPAPIMRTLEGIAGLRAQRRQDQRPLKLGYETNDPHCVETVRNALRSAGSSAHTVYSHGRLLDVLPPDVSKGHALCHLAKRLDVPIDETIAVGDSGNDLDMLRMAGKGIVVSNHDNELASLRTFSSVYFSTKPHAAGILDGVRAARLPPE